MAPLGAPTPARRADARRNRERVLTAARDALAEDGLGVAMDDVAGRAGVGVGTVYRHFPTKEAVVEAVAAEHFDALAVDASAALEDIDPGRAVAGFLRAAAARQAGDRALAEIMSARPELLHEVARRRADLYESIARLVDRAQAHGVLRRDFRPDDVPVLLCGLSSAVQMAGKDAHATRERYLGILLDGLRTPAAGRRA